MISNLYCGSVKNLLGPIQLNSTSALLFEYTDSFSVFDWGKMPDLLPQKGKALAVIAAEIFESIALADTWREFSKTPDALLLRKENRFGSSFNEIGEILQAEGLKTHYLGVFELNKQETSNHFSNQEDGFYKLSLVNSDVNSAHVLSVKNKKEPFRYIAVQPVSVVKPENSTILGQIVPNYQITRNVSFPKLIPLEIIFRMGMPEGSSLVGRIEKDPNYLSNIGFPNLKAVPGTRWNFPLIETFTKLENSDRHLFLTEALALSGLKAEQLQRVLYKSIWVASWLKSRISNLGLELLDGKLEWAIDERGECFLVDAIGPDELRIQREGVQLSKEFLRAYYRNSYWYQNLEKAKLQSKAQGVYDWKKLVLEGPPNLTPEYRELGTQIYLSLANALSDKKWFPNAWSINRVIEELRSIRKG